MHKGHANRVAIVIELHCAIARGILPATAYLTERELHLPLVHIWNNLMLLDGSPDRPRPVFIEHMRIVIEEDLVEVEGILPLLNVSNWNTIKLLRLRRL